jgi:ABC-type sugar transport system substrate-binding protein
MLVNIIALLVMIALATSGCTPAAPTDAPADAPVDDAADQETGVKAVEDMTLGVSFPSLMSGTWQATEENLKAYQEELGFELIETVADNDVNKQLSQIEDMIAQGVDAIIVDPIDSKAILSAIKAANDAGVPILLFDRPPADMEGVASFVGSDNYAFGQEAARQLNAFAEKNGVELKVLVLIGALTDENAVNRNDGFQEVAEELGIEMVTEVPTDWKTEKALDGVTNAFQALQDGYSTVDIAHDPVAWAQKPVDNAIILIQGGVVDPVFDALPGVAGTVENILELGNAFWGNAYVKE